MKLPPRALLAMIPIPLGEQLIRDAAKVRVGFPHWLKPFVQRNVAAITLGRRVYLNPSLLEKGSEYVTLTVRHELEHVRQVARDGIVRFFWVYLRDYIRLRRSGLDHFRAYSAIPYEVQARASEADFEAT